MDSRKLSLICPVVIWLFHLSIQHTLPNLLPPTLLKTADLLLTNTLVQDIQSQWSATEMSCSLNLVLHSSSKYGNIVLLKTVSNWFQPYALIYNTDKIKNNFRRLFHTPKRFVSPCWTVLVSCSHSEASLVKLIKILPRTIYDHFIFFSKSEDSLSSCHSFGHDHLLSTVSIVRKHIMYINKQNEIKYYIEPEIFTGYLSISSSPNFKKKLSNLRGRQYLPVTCIHFPPYMAKLASGKFGGLQFMFLSEIGKKENASFAYKLATGFGYRLQNGSWTLNSMVESLVSGKAEVCPVLAPTWERFPTFTYTSFEYLNSLFFCVKVPASIRPWQSIIHPLSPFVWLLIVITFLTFLVMLCAKLILEKQNLECPNFETLQKIPKLILELYTILLDQPNPSPPQGYSNRIIIFLWILFCYLIGVAYKCNLVGYLTFSEKQGFPTTFKELHENPQYSVVMQAVGGLEMELFKTSPSPIMKDLWKRMKFDPDILSCLTKVANGNDPSACIAWSSMIYNAIAMHSAKNDLLKSLYVAEKESGGVAHVTMALRRGSIFQEVFIRYVGWARAGYLIHLWYKMYMNSVEKEATLKARRRGKQKSSYKIDEKNEEMPITTGDILIVLGIWVIGSFLSLFCFLMEICIGHVKCKPI